MSEVKDIFYTLEKMKGKKEKVVYSVPYCTK